MAVITASCNAYIYAAVVNVSVLETQRDCVQALVCSWEVEPGSPQPSMYSVDWFRDNMQVNTSLIPESNETGLSHDHVAMYVLGDGGSCVGDYHAVVAGVDRFGRKGVSISSNAIHIPTKMLTGVHWICIHKYVW